MKIKLEIEIDTDNKKDVDKIEDIKRLFAEIDKLVTQNYQEEK